MDLQKEWENMGAEFTENTAPYTADYTAIKKDSKNLFETLVKALHDKMAWIRIFSVPALVCAIFADAPLKYLLLAVFIAYEAGRYLSVRKLKLINTQIDYTDVTKTVMTKQVVLMKQVLQVEKIWGFMFIPFAVPLGYIASQLIGHRSIIAIWYNLGPVYVISGWVIFTIAGLFIAQWMNKLAFGNHLKKLNDQIAQLGE